MELDEAVAALAVEVVVAGIAVLVLVDASRAERHFADQARLDQFGKRAIDRRPAELRAAKSGRRWSSSSSASK